MQLKGSDTYSSEYHQKIIECHATQANLRETKAQAQ